MRFVMVAVTVLSMNVAFAAKNGVQPNQFSAKIGSNLVKLFRDAEREDATFPALVYLKEQADLKLAVQERTREARIRYVYDALRTTATNSQKELTEFLTQKGLKFDRYFIANLVVVRSATKEQIQEIAERDDVLRVVANPNIHAIRKMNLGAAEAVSFSPTAVGDNITATGAESIWTQLNNQGEGIVVAGQDTGVEWDHPALINQYRGSGSGEANHDYNWHDAIHSQIAPSANRCGYELKVPCDDNDHGTHTIGTVVGSDGAQNQIGMAPKAKWIACRNMDGGVGSPQTYLECFQFFLAPTKVGGNPFNEGDPSKAPHVVNNSWGCPQDEGCEGGEFTQALEAIKAAGIMIVASAGNEGPGCGTIGSGPAFHTETTLSVGAMNHKTGKIASFSSRGPSTFDSGIGPDVSAPGENIRSAVTGKKYAQFGWSGTSMAGPHVVGAVALLWSLKPALIGNIEETSRLLRAGATAKTSTETCGGISGTQVPNNTFGHGALNVLKAAQL